MCGNYIVSFNYLFVTQKNVYVCFIKKKNMLVEEKKHPSHTVSLHLLNKEWIVEGKAILTAVAFFRSFSFGCFLMVVVT